MCFPAFAVSNSGCFFSQSRWKSVEIDFCIFVSNVAAMAKIVIIFFFLNDTLQF